MYDFTNLSKDQERKYEEFIKNICNINSCLSKGNTEEDLRSSFENELNRLLRELEFINNDYIMFEHETKHLSGRTDFLYGNTIIEYKRYGIIENEKIVEKSKEQLIKYLTDKKYDTIKMYGFIFDGKKIYALEKEENDSIIFHKEISGEINAKNMKYFINTIFNSGVRILSAKNLKNDFGILDNNERIVNNITLKLIRHLFSILINEKNTSLRTKLIFNEWEKLFRLAENDNGQHQDIKDRREIFSKIFGVDVNEKNEYKALFALHTALSIIIKILLVRFINEIPKSIFDNNYSEIKLHDYYKTDSLNKIKEFCNNIELGTYFEKINIINFTDNDFFAWYIKEEFKEEFKEIIQSIIYQVTNYENIYVAIKTKMIDIFRDLYQHVIPKCVRHSFGEYYTPYWLAEKTFLLASKHEQSYSEKKYLDPNCGSGTFLSVFYNYKNNNIKNKIEFSKYINGIVGIDINPIATLMSKANILLQALKYCKFNINAQYEIPVYLADSLSVPNIITIENIECYECQLYITGLKKEFNIDFIEMTLPKEFVEDKNFINKIKEIEKYIISGDNDKALNILIDNKFHKIKKHLEMIINNLVEYEKKGLNSIWLKILSGYFRVASYGKFDYIVGNPPWIQWSVLPEKYRQNVKDNIRVEGLFSNDGNTGGNNLNICALIANKSCERWLSDKGNFCFIMPKSILFNKSFEGFRKLIINNQDKEHLYFHEIDDFSKCGEIFDGVGLDFCCYKINSKVNTKNYIRINEYKKNENKNIKIYSNDDWDKIQHLYVVTRKYGIQLHTESHNNFIIIDNKDEIEKYNKHIGEFEYKFRKGVTAHYLMRLKFIENDKNNKSLAYFHPYKKVGSRIQVDEDNKIKLEKKYIKPYVTAPMLQENGYEWDNHYVIFPYETNAKQPMNQELLKQECPYIWNYIDSISKNLNQGSKFNKRVQKIDEIYGILRIGTYVYRKIFICIRDNTKLAPNIISAIKTHWNTSVTPLFDNHISYISEVERNGKIIALDEEEASYILAKLRTKEVQYIIMNSQDSRSISSRLPIKLELMKNDDGHI